ncbi:glycosyltransferase family 87 protein [uncultured Sneathiella sp.]|uniref:glycosyltransferase family 87 protein n=1 Tax=uncultured Sneathiella sp. TaxID=879315 RepID=UPI0030DACAD8|tara:strand:+ start:3422 stop:4843 length:1422 start_codon:yes stop_codon:yes gene_type:complete
MLISDIRNGKSNSLVYLFLIMGGVIALGFVKYFFGEGLIGGKELLFLKYILSGNAYADSWDPMYQAALQEMNNPESGLYQTIFFENNVKFQYPPASLLPFMGLIWLNISWEGILHFMNAISLISMFGIAVCVYIIATTAAEYYTGRIDYPAGLKIFLFLVLLTGTLFFYPILRGQYLGQIQIPLDFLISLTFVVWLQNGKLSAGVLIALATLIKPQFGLLLIWAAIRKEGRFCAGMFLVLVPAGIISLLVFGFGEHVDYLSVLSYIGKHGEVFLANQSFNGLLNRLLSDVDPLKWEAFSYAPYNVYVYAGTLVSTIGFLLFGLLYRPTWVRATGADSDPMVSSLDLSTMFILLTIASPIAWEHHYGVIWPVIILLLVGAINLVKVKPDRAAKLCLMLIVIGYYLVANLVEFVAQDIFSKAPLNLLQSYHFVGGVILLISVIILRKQMKPLYDPAMVAAAPQGENSYKLARRKS